MHRDLCTACETELPRIHHPCARCGLDIPVCSPWHSLCGSCISKPPPFRRFVTALAYQPPLPGLIAAFKYQERLVVGRELARVLADEISARYYSHPLPDFMVPVPLHRKRLRQRGFNQSLEIARDLARLLDLPVMPSLVTRSRHTTPQTGLGARERQQNLHNAFEISSRDSFPSRATIAIVDDVVTTGTTVNALANTLLRAGAGEVHVWALARTPL